VITAQDLLAEEATNSNTTLVDAAQVVIRRHTPTINPRSE
jgi:hypothetical protein